MSDITELRQNIERLNKSTTAALKKQSYTLLQKNIVGIESELGAVQRELVSKTDVVDELKKENLVLKQDYAILDNRVQEILKEKAESDKKLEQLSRTRPELSSANLVKAFRDSLVQMDESINSESSRVDYNVSSMNIKLRTNIAVKDDELRFQLPKADDVIPADNLSEVEFTINSSSKERIFSDYIDVPDVVGLDMDLAVSIIKAAGFVQGEVIEKDSSLGQATVLSQIPSGSSVAKAGDAVDLVISKITSVEVPNIVGMNLASAQKALEAGKLHSGKVTEQTDAFNVGKVLSQSVAAGEYADIGSAIDLVVATSKVEFTAVSGITAKPVVTGTVRNVRAVLSDRQAARISSVRKSTSGN
ncbi:PASTA domain-containing protein [Methanolobus sp. ZRKC5]|uniref:PASTA domain-containing protein n=1 Tax=unclassified Methanolobus TaxID=2629569 RepID=UPI00313CEC26